MSQISSNDSLNLRESEQEGITVIAVIGEVDRANAGHLLDRLDSHLRSKTRYLILDLRLCTHLDSAGLSAMLGYVSRMRKGSGLAVAGPNSDLRRLFALVGLDGRRGFDIYEDVDEAIAGFLAAR